MSGEYREYSSEDKRRLDRLGLDSNRYKGNYSADEVEGAYRNQLDKPMSGLEQDALYRAYGALKARLHVSILIMFLRKRALLSAASMSSLTLLMVSVQGRTARRRSVLSLRFLW